MVLFDLQSEIHSGFFLSYYSNFAIPSTAKTLAATGEMTSRLMASIMDKPEVAAALGLKAATAVLRVPFNAVLRVRALKARDSFGLDRLTVDRHPSQDYL